MRYRHVIIGGDMNSANIGLVARDAGYVWPTDAITRSATFARLDHIYMKGLMLAGRPAAGTVTTAPLVSDHRPIWVSALPSP